uniref:TRIM32 n=1 Tax=Penaeus vannamei TaxID=6689 RepID=A0A8F5FUV6_PENVA|nr:TRIM32 [Penaeus vannamei]
MASMSTAVCQVCFSCYDSEAKRPRILPCGHTFCSQCLLNITERNDGLIACPLCKRETKVTDISQLTTNFSILDLTSQDDQEEGAQLPSKASAKAEQGPPLSAGFCEDHGQHQLFKCKSCDEWICHVCTVIEHPMSTCNVISVKKALEETRNNINAEVEQFILEQNQTFDRIGVYDKELQTLEKEYKKKSLELEHVVEQYKQAEQSVAGELIKLKKAQEEGLSKLQDLKELQIRVSKLSRIQDTDDCSQAVSQCKKSVQTWTQDILHMTSGQNMLIKSQMHNLVNFSMELMNWNTLKNLEFSQLQAITDSASESIMVSLITLTKPLIVIKKDNQAFCASVTLQVNNTAMVGELCPFIPSSSTTSIDFTDLMKKIPEAYVRGQKTYYRIEKHGNEDLFTMVPMNDDSMPADRLHLLIPMNTLIQAGVVWVEITKERFGHLTKRQEGPECAGGATAKYGYQLHAFVDHLPPDESFIFKCNLYEDLISQPVVVFLRLAWRGKTQGDIIIELEDDSLRSKQFLKLCIGDSEHSYRGTSLLSIHNFGIPGEGVVGGGYEQNDGTVYISLYPDIPDNEKVAQPIIEGLLSGLVNGVNDTLFIICTRSHPGSVDWFSFGRVTAGMDVLKKVMLVSNIRDVVIEDCGVVL